MQGRSNYVQGVGPAYEGACAMVPQPCFMPTSRCQKLKLSILSLSIEQIEQRDAVMAEPIWPPIPKERGVKAPKFMGWTAHQWSLAPTELIEHFGMQTAWEAWQAERAAMGDHIERLMQEEIRRKERIVAECGDRARAILCERGLHALFAAYEADPTLGGTKA